MTVHPWPRPDDSSPARPSILWKHGGGSGLMIDAGAVPLRFEPDLSDDDAPAQDRALSAPPPAARLLQFQLDAATLRIRELEAQLQLQLQRVRLR